MPQPGVQKEPENRSDSYQRKKMMQRILIRISLFPDMPHSVFSEKHDVYLLGNPNLFSIIHSFFHSFRRWALSCTVMHASLGFPQMLLHGAGHLHRAYSCSVPRNTSGSCSYSTPHTQNPRLPCTFSPATSPGSAGDSSR